MNSNWTRSSFLKLDSSQKQLGNHTAVCKPATVIQQFYFTGDSRFFVSGVNINFKVQSKFLTSAEVLSSSLPSFLIICFCYHGIWTINPRPWDPLPKVAYQGKGIYTFDIKFKWLMRQNVWECLDMSKVLINNFRVSVMLLKWDSVKGTALWILLSFTKQLFAEHLHSFCFFLSSITPTMWRVERQWSPAIQ